MELFLTGREWSELGSRDIDGKAERPSERARVSQYFPELGIYDYRHRYYNPSLGRFLQIDPTGFDAGDMNLFRYCGDDPVDRTDPTGLDSDVYLYREYADRDAPGRYVIYNDVHKQIYSGPANRNPFYANTHGVRAGDYTLQPKGTRWGPIGKKDFPADQPAITGSARGLKPGQPNSSYRLPALVHYALPFGRGADSAGCVTVAQDAVDKTKEVMGQDRKSGGVTRFHIREPELDPVTIKRAESSQDRSGSDNGGLGGSETGNNTDYSRQLDQALSSYLMGVGDNSGEGFHPRGPR